MPRNMDRLITIQDFVSTVDEYGEPIETWEEFAQVWARKEQLSGREFFKAAQTMSERKTVFHCRWLDGVKVTFLVADKDGELYNINEVREVGRRSGMELHCTASGQT